MYRWLRNTHLFLGLFCCLYVLMYGVSSVKFSHQSWFPATPTVIESSVTVPPEIGTSARAVARELMEKHGMTGELTAGRETPGGFSFRIVRSGMNYTVDYRRGNGEARVTTRKPSFMQMMVNMHNIEHGLWHESALRQAAGILVGVVSAALIILALSGIYLWFKIHQERLIGSILLALSLGYSLTVIILLRLA